MKMICIQVNLSSRVGRHILVVLALLLPSLGFSQTSKKPNIIIILADDLGWGDVGYLGSDIKTPNLDQLAKEGVILNRYYTATVCSPTRAGLLTGRYPDRFGLRATTIAPWTDFGVDTSEVFLPEKLRDAGYQHRAIIGKWHLGHSKKEYHPLQRGFTHFYGHLNGAIDYFTHKREGELDWHNDYETSYDKGYATDLISQEAVKSIKEYNGKSPFFIYVAYNAPHSPLQAKKEDLLKYGYDENKPAYNNLTGEKTRGKGNTKRQTYAAMVTSMDEGIGKILKTLKDLNIDQNTLVLFHSDNGAGEAASSGVLRGRKFQEWEGGVRAPAIIKWPAGFKGGRVSNQVMGYVDVMPTLCQIAGVKGEPAAPFDGINVLPALVSEKNEKNRDFYLGYGTLINKDWKLISEGTKPTIKIDEDLLFHISKDPTETKDVKASNPAVLHDMKKKVAVYDAITSARQVPDHDYGREGFKAPKEWKIEATKQ